MGNEERERTPGRISAALRREASDQTAPTSEQHNPVHGPAPDVEQVPTEESIVSSAVIISEPKLRTASRRWTWIIIAGIAWSTAIFWMAWALGRHSIRPDPTVSRLPNRELAVTLRPNGQDLLLEWKSALPTLQSAGAEVFDGDTVRHLDLTSALKGQSAIPIGHTTGNVQVAVTAIDQSGHSSVRTIGFTDLDAVNRDMTSAAQRAEAAPSRAEPSAASASKSSRKKRHRRR